MAFIFGYIFSAVSYYHFEMMKTEGASYPLKIQSEFFIKMSSSFPAAIHLPSSYEGRSSQFNENLSIW